MIHARPHHALQVAFNRATHTPQQTINRASRNFRKMSAVTVQPLPSRSPDPSSATRHHVGSPPTAFRNPWPSGQNKPTLSTVLKTRYGDHPEKAFVPVPQGANGQRSGELVNVRRPDWAQDRPDRLRATWIGHASFLVETPVMQGAKRGVRIFFDPVFSERTSPFSFLGPKRYSPTPCLLSETPDVDIVCISHNHYDHLDYDAVSQLYKRRGANIHFLVPLNVKPWFVKHICPPECVTEMDWWESVEVRVPEVGSVTLTATPCQHASRRSAFDGDHGLWCSWSLEAAQKKLYFAGDTGYQAPDTPSACPTFAQVGSTLGPFDLALLPIGLFKPPSMMGAVHCSPEQALQIHKDVRSRLSIGMHYGTVRGGVSGQYEPVTEPPRRWREAAEKEDLWRGGGIEGDGEAVDTSREGAGLCDIGETVAV